MLIESVRHLMHNNVKKYKTKDQLNNFIEPIHM